jgi:putative transcription factor
MPECEICGRIAALSRTRVEGVLIRVCPQCEGHGVRVQETPPEVKPREPEFREVKINPDFALMIKAARESKGFTREQLATRLGERESVLGRVERGMRPHLALARRLERVLGINLKGEQPDTVKIPPQKKHEITLGDIVEVKVKKK